ncbi:MAG: glucosaminidase domain-containing protein [Bacteroidales bacterium]
MRFSTAIFLLFLVAYKPLIAQPLVQSDYIAYINTYKSIATREMELYKIPASITLSQAIIESGCGKSVLATNSLNHFGIKCQKEWTGQTYYFDDDKPKECFRKYDNVDESYRDHSKFLSTRARYASLFTLQITDYKGWAIGLKQAGYATNPEYANILIRLIEKYELYLLDDTSAKAETEIAEDLPKEDFIKKNEKPNVEKPEIAEDNNSRILFRKRYKMPDPAKFKFAYTSDLGRKVYENNGVPFVFAQQGDTWYTIAGEFKIYSFQIYKQNDLLKSDSITPGQILYLEPKKKKNPAKIHKVEKSESLYSISQEKCIRLNRLLKYNNLQPGMEPKPGTELKLSR